VRSADVKGLYRKAAAGELAGLTGWDAPYEEPLDAEAVVLPTAADSGVDPVLNLILERLG